MKSRKVYLGERTIRVNPDPVTGGFEKLDGERFYRITNTDRMPDFFMSLVSSSDQWMFISSNGSLTAGRKNPEGALFPYYSEDKIHDYRGTTGSMTLILVEDGKKLKLWEPFAAAPGIYPVKRSIYKNLYGNKLIFEEYNRELNLSFRYGWYTSNRYGFVKRSSLVNLGAEPVRAEVLDGLQNILPSGVDSGLQLTSSNLLDAYKRQELIAGTTLGIYRLSSVPTDAAQPSEALRVSTVWSAGLPDPLILLSSRQVDRFRSGYVPEPELDVKATRGAYFAHAGLELQAGEHRTWDIVAEVNQDANGVAALIELLHSGESAANRVVEDIERSQAELVALLAPADALQQTADELSTARHLSNVLFNVMRGGIFADQYRIQPGDFLDFIARTNPALQPLAGLWFTREDLSVSYRQLQEKARAGNHPGLIRLCYEYLALTFSRRHGDPSRPWNRFSIENRKADGSRSLDYQGNWRDIFQNWEALSLSFPEYVESMICRFVNASTADGYNPYRIMRHGIEWEVPDPSDPWSNIGYWGDHQLIYLLKFLEISANHHPGTLQQLLSSELFTYAQVPYRIKSYKELLDDPHHTILFDTDLDEAIRHRVAIHGSDGKLLPDQQGEPFLVNLAEKLLVPLLSKLSNFIPGAGIWMNTQRPEWNDANNALVGYGVSVVTTCHLRAYTSFCSQLFQGLSGESIRLTEEVSDYFSRMKDALDGLEISRKTPISGKGMKSALDGFGLAGSDYRQVLYQSGFTGKRREVPVERILNFLERTRGILDGSIASNRRSDGLYHAYNLMRVDGEQIALRRLYEMLEGQVAVLSSGFLSGEESAMLLDALRASKLFREDQYSYILYPDRSLPSFLEKNVIPATDLKQSRLLQRLLGDSNHRILVKDVNGTCHFHGDFRNAGDLRRALDDLPDPYQSLVREERGLILELFEKVFDHQSFTGRSGTFYGYEGLGSIYWHMVSKLLLAVCESFYRAADGRSNPETLKRLAAHYYEIRSGLGLNKTPEGYGAFPTDPYSHTPAGRGAQQPGMTGQVKEDIIARWGELGIRVQKGTICFQPLLLRRDEFLQAAADFSYLDLAGRPQRIDLERGTLAFTYCQVPVVYHLSEKRKIVLTGADGTEDVMQGDTLDPQRSAMIFQRSGTIGRVDVWLNPAL